MFALFAMAALGADAEPPKSFSGVSDTTVQTVKFEPKDWKLAWSDEFKGGPVPDSRNWVYEEGYVRNGEAQFYTKDRRENARVENGRLVIEARKDNWDGKPITSASLTTEGKRSLLYGRIEVKAKIPTGRGTWPAIWTLGENIRQVGWPKCGEIDIMENVGFDPSRIHGNIHVDDYNHMKGNGKGNNLLAEKPWEKFNIYATEWYPDRVEMFFNDQRYLVYRNEGKGESSWPFDKPHYLILNVAIGGGWGGAQGIDDAIFPAKMEVEYVRYYQRAKR